MKRCICAAVLSLLLAGLFGLMPSPCPAQEETNEVVEAEPAPRPIPAVSGPTYVIPIEENIMPGLLYVVRRGLAEAEPRRLPVAARHR